METIVLKNRIQEFLERADERVLNIVNGVFESYYKDEIIAYHPDGKPMTREEYKSGLEEAEEQIQKGDYISAEEFRQELNERRRS